MIYISLTIFTAYFLFIWIKYGLQKSFSDSYYSLPEKTRPYIFTAFIFGFTVPMIPISYEYQLMLLSIWLIMGVGATAQFRKHKYVRVIHMIVAVSGILLSQLSIIIEFHMWPIAACLFVLCTLIVWKSNRPIWWIEAAVFYSIILAFLIK